MQSAEKIEVKRPWAVLVSTPGVVDERVGRVLLSPNLHWSEHADLPWILRQIWSAPVGLVQEVRALALGELGSRPDGDDFIMIDISDGVGGALMLGGRIYQGALPMSGEIGHTPIPGNNRLCGCGGRGCLETLASRARSDPEPARSEGAPPTHVLTFADVVKAAERELPPWMRATFDAIATCVSAALNLYGVRRVVMVGRITELPAPATDYLIGVIQRASMWSRFDAVAVTLAPKRVSRGSGRRRHSPLRDAHRLVASAFRSVADPSGSARLDRGGPRASVSVAASQRRRWAEERPLPLRAASGRRASSPHGDARPASPAARPGGATWG